MLSWVALKTVPQHRIEFLVLHRITQWERPALLPVEIVHETRPGKNQVKLRKYALFPTYVFAGLQDVKMDYLALRGAIPEIKGIVSRARGEWSPLILSDADVRMLSALVEGTSGATEVSLHKALQPGKKVNVYIGSDVQETKIDSVTKKGVRVLLNMLGSMHVVEVPFDKVRAA
jgi:transcription antitermination factor NusG